LWLEYLFITHLKFELFLFWERNEEYQGKNCTIGNYLTNQEWHSTEVSSKIHLQMYNLFIIKEDNKRIYFLLFGAKIKDDLTI